MSRRSAIWDSPHNSYPDDFELAEFRLVGEEYEAIPMNESGHLWSNVLGLYLEIHNEQLRYFSPEGQLVPTPEEAALQAQALVETERQRAERLAERLRSLGIDPDVD